MTKNIINIIAIIPYFWIFLFITILMIATAIKTENKKTKLILANLVVIPMLICVSEFVCWKINTKFYLDDTLTVNMPQRLYEYNKKTGCTHCKNVKVHATGKYRREKIYDVYYTIDKNGLRQTPSSNNQSNQCLLFFGDSFIFGLALNDNETLPYYIGEKTNNKYKIYNFGVGGYSPASVLFQIERGNVTDVAKSCKASTAIIDFMPDHIVRVAGKKTWSEWSPEYELINDEVIYKGPSNRKTIKFPEFIRNLGCKSQTYIYLNRIIVSKNATLSSEEFAKNLNLSVALLDKSRKLLEEKCNVNHFIVLYYDDIRQNRNILDKLRIDSLDYYPASGILPNFKKMESKYFIKVDGHPNKLVNEALANFLVKQLELN